MLSLAAFIGSVATLVGSVATFLGILRSYRKVTTVEEIVNGRTTTLENRVVQLMYALDKAGIPIPPPDRRG